MNLFAPIVTLMLRVEVRDCYALKLLLQISQSLIIRLCQGVCNRIQRVLRIVAWLPINRTQDAMLSNSLEGFEKPKRFEHAAPDSEIVERNLQTQSSATSSPNLLLQITSSPGIEV